MLDAEDDGRLLSLVLLLLLLLLLLCLLALPLPLPLRRRGGKWHLVSGKSCQVMLGGFGVRNDCRLRHASSIAVLRELLSKPGAHTCHARLYKHGSKTK